eukprot:364525-Chlamydomonas_euryale.AAC.2
MLFTQAFICGRNNFHIFCRQITIIAKSTIYQAWTWINSTLATGLHARKGCTKINHSCHGERKTVSYVQPVGAS